MGRKYEFMLDYSSTLVQLQLFYHSFRVCVYSMNKQISSNRLRIYATITTPIINTVYNNILINFKRQKEIVLFINLTHESKASRFQLNKLASPSICIRYYTINYQNHMFSLEDPIDKNVNYYIIHRAGSANGKTTD